MSEDPGSWPKTGLGREWDPSAAHFSMEMLIFHCFYKVLATPSGSSQNARFISFSGAQCAVLRADQPEYRESLDSLVFFMLFAAECVNVHADSEYYCESPDM